MLWIHGENDPYVFIRHKWMITGQTGGVNPITRMNGRMIKHTYNEMGE